jgi:hypothetical protein
MAVMERVTMTLPRDLLDEVDRLESNRSRFMVAALRRELVERRREALRRSLDQPHSETESFVDAGLAEWASLLPNDADSLVDTDAGTPIRWVSGEGWVEESR